MSADKNVAGTGIRTHDLLTWYLPGLGVSLLRASLWSLTSPPCPAIHTFKIYTFSFKVRFCVMFLDEKEVPLWKGFELATTNSDALPPKREWIFGSQLQRIKSLNVTFRGQSCANSKTDPRPNIWSPPVQTFGNLGGAATLQIFDQKKVSKYSFSNSQLSSNKLDWLTFRHLAMGIRPLPLHTWVFNAPIHYSLLLQVSPVRIAFLDLWWVG